MVKRRHFVGLRLLTLHVPYRKLPDWSSVAVSAHHCRAYAVLQF